MSTATAVGRKYRVLVASDRYAYDYEHASELFASPDYRQVALVSERESLAYGLYDDVVWIDTRDVGEDRHSREAYSCEAWEQTTRCEVSFMVSGRCVLDRGHDGNCVPVANYVAPDEDRGDAEWCCSNGEPGHIGACYGRPEVEPEASEADTFGWHDAARWSPSQDETEPATAHPCCTHGLTGLAADPGPCPYVTDGHPEPCDLCIQDDAGWVFGRHVPPVQLELPLFLPEFRQLRAGDRVQLASDPGPIGTVERVRVYDLKTWPLVRWPACPGIYEYAEAELVRVTEGAE